jgi:hypothetical protein
MFTLVISLALAAQSSPSEYCPDTSGVHADRNTVWVVDTDIVAALDGIAAEPGVLTIGDYRALLDRVLQQNGRSGRPRLQMRTTYANCAPGDNRCITAVADDDFQFPFEDGCCTAGDFGCSKAGAAAAATCKLGTCSIRICSDRFEVGDGSFFSGDLESILAHELGHNLGLDHVDIGSSSIPCLNTTDCQVGETCTSGSCMFGANAPCRGFSEPGCSNATEACSGQLMCQRGGCGGPGLADGDMRGLRAAYPDGTNRRVYQSNEAAALGQVMVSNYLGVSSRYQPRIDCAESTVTYTQCFAATSNLSSVGVRRLSSFGAQNTFAINSSLTNTIALGSRILFAPDVASTPTGYGAWVTYVTSSDGGELHVARVDASAGTVLSDVAIDEVSIRNPGLIDTFRTERLTPLVAARVFVNSDFPDCAFVAVSHRQSLPPDPENFSTLHSLSIFRVCGSSSLLVTQVSPGSLQLGNGAFTIGEFDVDCAVQSGADTCMISSHRLSPDSVDSIWSRRFSISSTPNIAFLGNWESGSYRANGVFGVSAVGSGPMTFISAGRSVYGSSLAEGNSRNLRYDSLFTVGNAAASSTPISDRQTCSSATDGTDVLPAMTMNGGYSTSWCPTCGGGRLIGLNFGYRSDNDTFCY